MQLFDETSTARLIGQVERITFSNEENGYTIARVCVDGRDEAVTVVGHLFAPMLGEILDMHGEWTVHKVYGRQFRVERFSAIAPASLEGIEKFLSSGAIRGIGPAMAARIVEHFGDATLGVLEHEPYRLAEIEGIGPKRIEIIRNAWGDTRDVRRVMIFLQSHGVSPAYANRIYRTYGNEAIGLITANPYRMAIDVAGIGFLSADKIAQSIGYERNSGARAAAGILYLLNQLSVEGHVYYPSEALVRKCAEMLGVDALIVRQALGELVAAGRLVLDELNPDFENFEPDNKAVYLDRFHVYERGVAGTLLGLRNTPKYVRRMDFDREIDAIQERLRIRLAGRQRQAVRAACENGVTVISGGPGTGKTTIVSVILELFDRQQARVLLAAPTGRAAKRLSEATGHAAATIHRLLEYSINEGFKKGPANQLDCDVLIVDEASMVDTALIYYLLRAVPATTVLVMVGDVDQLPSVGPGNVLKDVIDSGVIPVVMLDEIFRQAGESLIIRNAHLVNHGQMPDITRENDGDFYFINREEPEEVLETVVSLVRDNMPERFGLDAVNDIQVLSPVHKGTVGVQNLNARLQQALNASPEQVELGQRVFKVRDKVMQLRNDYTREVYNGDIGRIARISRADQEIVINYDGREVCYEYGDMEDVSLAYAVTVHKSQGSEYPAVVIPLVPQHYMMLQRNLIYTAISRGKRLVVMVGSRRALAMAVRNNRTQKRYTNLKMRLEE